MENKCAQCQKMIEEDPEYRIYWDDKDTYFFFCSIECRETWLEERQNKIIIKKRSVPQGKLYIEDGIFKITPVTPSGAR